MIRSRALSCPEYYPRVHPVYVGVTFARRRVSSFDEGLFFFIITPDNREKYSCSVIVRWCPAVSDSPNFDIYQILVFTKFEICQIFNSGFSKCHNHILEVQQEPQAFNINYKHLDS